MRLTKEDERRLGEILAPYREHELVQALQRYPHHGQVTTYTHVSHVTEACYLMNKRWHLHADEQVLVAAAFLHDFYLYDWHEKDATHRWHAFRHPTTACRNAVETFQIGTREQRIIRTHMWPLVPYRVPTSREAWLLTIADKYCAVKELIQDRRERWQSRQQNRTQKSAKGRQRK